MINIHSSLKVIFVALLCASSFASAQETTTEIPAPSDIGEGFGEPDSLNEFEDIPLEEEEEEVDDFTTSPLEATRDEQPLLEPVNSPPPPRAEVKIEMHDDEEEAVAPQKAKPLKPVSQPKPRPQPQYGNATGAEENFHRIYENYIKNPISLDQWTQIVGPRQSESYSIQKGDTLWDISKTFFDDGTYWPKIWSLNASITNPHLVQPGFKVQFSPGVLHGAPSLKIVKEGVQDVDGASIPLAAIEAGISIPPPEKPKASVVTGIPQTFPRYSYLPPENPETQVELETVDLRFPEPVVPVNQFVSDKSFVSLGQMSGSENGSSTAASFDLIFIKLKPGEGKIGDQYTLIRKLGQVAAPKKDAFREKSVKINKYEAQGTIKVLELVNSRENIYRAEVVRSYQPLSTEAMIVRDAMPFVDLNATGKLTRVDGRVIGGGLGKHKIFGPSTFIFLDAGQLQGVNKGDLVNLYANPLVRFSEVKVRLNHRPIAVAKIADVSQNFSTAVILKASEEVREGDLTSSGAKLVQAGADGLLWVEEAPQVAQAATPMDEVIMDDSGPSLETDLQSDEEWDEFDF